MMNETVRFLARHGYWLLVGAMLGRQSVFANTRIVLIQGDSPAGVSRSHCGGGGSDVRHWGKREIPNFCIL
jgi:hypothetical protein